MLSFLTSSGSIKLAKVFIKNKQHLLDIIANTKLYGSIRDENIGF